MRGGNFYLFRPDGFDRDHEEYTLEVLKERLRWFGPFPKKFCEIASEEVALALLYLLETIPREKTTPFHLVTERQFSKKDKEFIGRTLLFDWRDRPTAAELLKDPWWEDDAEVA